MNRKIIVIFLVLMATAILASSISSAFAVTTYTDHEHAGATCVIDVPGKTMIRLIAYGQMYGDYYSGKADRIQILVYTGSGWRYVVGYEDVPERSAFSAGLGLGTVENVVEPGQIQVLRVGESTTVMVHWNIPLVCPATDTTPAVTLPPGKLVVVGFGEAKPVTVSNAPIGTTGWKYSIVATYHSATATLFCEGWDYKWLPVGAAFAGTSLEPRSIDDRIWTWTHA